MNTQSKHLKPGMIFRSKKSYSVVSGLVLQFPSIKTNTEHEALLLPATRNSFLYLSLKGNIEEYMLYDGIWDWVEVIE